MRATGGPAQLEWRPPGRELIPIDGVPWCSDKEREREIARASERACERERERESSSSSSSSKEKEALSVCTQRGTESVQEMPTHREGERERGAPAARSQILSCTTSEQ